MAVMLPNAFPHDLTRKPRLQGEALVFAALQTALDDDWCVFYDRPIKGSRRRIDFLAAHAQRGMLAIEIKGGMVHDRRGSFRQLISAIGQRKRIDPFGQLKAAVRDLHRAVGVEANDALVHEAIWFPEMGQAGLRWPPSDHILTRECLEPKTLAELVNRVLPMTTLDPAVIAPFLKQF